MYRYIAIEGNIGSGKSTLAHMLSRHYDGQLILEEFADNNFLPKFYKEPERYAFPLELSFLADRFKQLKQLTLNHDMFQQKVIADYILTKSKLFAKVNLEENEYELFQKLFDIINPNLPAPDLLVYLHTPIAMLQENIRKRGRSYEQNIPDSYLKKVEEVYLEFLKQETIKTLVIDTTRVDFVSHPDHFLQLTHFLEAKKVFRTHYLNLPA